VRRLLVVAALAALAAAPAARAHVTVLPTYLEQGKRSTLVFSAPNERAPHSVVDLTITFPRGVELSAVSPPSGWQVTILPANARWSGGRTGPGTTTDFKVDARTDGAPGTDTVYAVQRYDDGKSVRWTLPVTVVPATTSPKQHLWLALGIGVIAFFAIFCGLVYIRRRRPAVEAS
jgi:uncharacterized protein YcnI